MESSAYRRIWERSIYCIHLGERIDDPLGIRIKREDNEEAVESKRSLGTNRAKGFMAGYYHCRPRGEFEVLKLF